MAVRRLLERLTPGRASEVLSGMASNPRANQLLSGFKAYKSYAQANGPQVAAQVRGIATKEGARFHEAYQRYGRMQSEPGRQHCMDEMVGSVKDARRDFAQLVKDIRLGLSAAE